MEKEQAKPITPITPPERIRELYAKIRRESERGTRLLLVDFWTDQDHIEPPIAPLIAGEFLIATGEGDVYSVEENRRWLEETGWKIIQHTNLRGPQSLIVAEAT
jgi:hypothetical protein